MVPVSSNAVPAFSYASPSSGAALEGQVSKYEGGQQASGEFISTVVLQSTGSSTCLIPTNASIFFFFLAESYKYFSIGKRDSYLAYVCTDR